MFTRKTTGLLVAGLAFVGAAFAAQSAKADETPTRPAVLTTSDNDSTIQLVRHRGWRRGGWGGYGYRPYRWGGYYRPYRGYGYWGPAYGYGYPAYGYGYSYPSYNYYNPGFGIYVY